MNNVIRHLQKYPVSTLDPRTKVILIEEAKSSLKQNKKEQKLFKEHPEDAETAAILVQEEKELRAAIVSLSE